MKHFFTLHECALSIIETILTYTGYLSTFFLNAEFSQISRLFAHIDPHHIFDTLLQFLRC